MFRRLLIVMSTVLCALALIVPAAQASCTLPDADNHIDCPNSPGQVTGDGSISASGTIGTLGNGLRIRNGNGWIVSFSNIGALQDGIKIDMNGFVFSEGGIVAGKNGIEIGGNGGCPHCDGRFVLLCTVAIPEGARKATKSA